MQVTHLGDRTQFRGPGHVPEVGPWEPQEDQGGQIQCPEHGLRQLQYQSRSELVPLLSFFHSKSCYQALHSQRGLRLGVFPAHVQDLMRFPWTHFSSLSRSSRMAPSFGCITCPAQLPVTCQQAKGVLDLTVSLIRYQRALVQGRTLRYTTPHWT